MEQVAGLEPALNAWQALVLTTNTIPAYGAGGGSRTHNLRITSALRYHCATPAIILFSYMSYYYLLLAQAEGLEPPKAIKP